MGSEFVTREEHVEAIRRLDEADAELRKAQTELERTLRHDYEAKIADAVTNLKDEIKGVRDEVKTSGADLKERIGGVKAALASQNKWALGIVATIIALTIAALIAKHFGFTPA